MDKTRINLYQLLSAISSAVDLVTPQLANHHQEVAYLSYRIAEQLKLPDDEKQKVFMAGLIHDIGALTSPEKLRLLENDPTEMREHSYRGAKLLEDLDYILDISEVVRCHHVAWEHGKGEFLECRPVPMTGHIVYIADRTCLLFKKNKNALSQLPMIISEIKAQRGTYFVPEHVDAIEKLGIKEHIWFELMSQNPTDYIEDMNQFPIKELKLDDLIEISKMFSYVIDFRSRFTATHSAGVAKTAHKLAQLANFSENECKMMLVAGYLHDLGKLAVENSILEKDGPLNDDEYNIMRKHTFDTYMLLKKVDDFETINKWASFHHERLDGKGYPFRLTAEDIPLGSRIMAVADIFTALIEDRPYRKSLPKEKIIDILSSMVEGGAICKSIVKLVEINFDEVAKACKESQKQAIEDYDNFYLK